MEFEIFERKEKINNDVIIKSPGIDVNEYEDKSFKESSISIYTARTLDAHGNLSLYSNQIALLYNAVENELIVDSISRPGAPIDMPNVLIPRKTILLRNENFSVTNLPICSDVKDFTLFLTPEFVKLTNNELDGEDVFNVLNSKYKFSFSKLNTLDRHESIFNIENFDI